MELRRIIKDRAQHAVRPNLPDYRRGRADFSWARARRALEGLPGGGLNIAHEAVTRHARGARRDHVALAVVGRGGEVANLSYGELEVASNRFAHVLAGLGLRPGERVFTLLARVPELYFAALGTWKTRAIFCPLFPAFGPEPIRQRLALGGARVLVTTPELYRKKVADLRTGLPQLEHVLLTGPELDGRLAAAPEHFEIPATEAEDPAILHFTSGTTGRPKGALHVHGAVVAHHATAAAVLDLHPEDVFWCTADPGWVTGTSYGIVAPLTHGVTSVIDAGDFDAERWYGILESQRVTVWYTAPTAIRVLMKVGAELPRRFDLSGLRHVASVGEPLNPEAVIWGQDALGLPIHDNWWQTETGAIMIANLPCLDIKPGSMGRPVPGVEAGIVARQEDGSVLELAQPEALGELALRPGWPSMFRAYLGEEERYRKCFAGGWYLTGDLARRDEEGYFWFVGRADDVIKTSGHLIGPFEVESVLMEHPAVAEAGVIGKPDPMAGELIKAFVSLKGGFSPGEELRLSLLGHARKRLGAALAPKEIEIVPALPRTRSGKILRRLLKARELGLPEGDLSTLEVPA
ncbi:MAG TPA: acetate--CoA ligase [Thermoanaerobaculia bacterium]|nr:acetate--CoA ligase [Thermoanaerobaculia bacterium]